jgi:hypothetical protein
MFGTQTQQSNDDPAMLDNVKALASQPNDSVTPQNPATAPQTGPSSPPTPSSNVSFASAPQPQQPVPPNTAPPSPQPSESAVGPPPQPVPMQSDSAASNDAPAPTGTDNSSDSSSPSTSTNPSSATAPDPSHLAGLKQQALDHLEPLTDHIDGSPEEVFKTTMMMIQANDNHTLLERALEAAKKIEDDKARAQAMLDIVNEINYFSQSSSEEQ